MKLLGKTIGKITFMAVILAVVVAGTVAATLWFMKTIPGVATIEKPYNLQIYWTETGEDVVTFDFGTVQVTQQVPGVSTTPLFNVKNVGSHVIYACWRLDPATPLPTGCSLKAYHTDTTEWPEGEKKMLEVEAVAAYYLLPRCSFELTVTMDAEVGAISFNIVFEGHDA